MATTRQEGHTIVKNQKRATAFILAVAIFGDAAAVFAQNPAHAPSASPAVAPIVPSTMGEQNIVHLQVGRSAIVDVGSPIARVSLTSADVADAMVTTPRQLLVNGKLPGTISMFVWDKGGTLRRYEVNVGRNLDQLSTQMRQLFPGERVEVQNTGKNIVVSGTVSSKEMAEKVVNVASGYVEKKEEVVNLLQIDRPEAAKQVLLRVRFAEVSRSAMSELGATLYGDGAKNAIGRITTGQFGAPTIFDQKQPMVGETQIFSDFLNLFLFSYKDQFGAVVKALQSKGLFESLAEPNLVAESGKEASFLAGGEFPVPVVQGSGGSMAVSIMFKEFGIRLNFTPQVNGDRVHLKVRPEVSTLDFNNAVVLQGFRIPALSTRRTETELELQDGQTFAIAGLMNNKVASTMQKIPGIGDIPVLGMLFRSKAAQKEQTELVVMITPEILKMNSPGVTPNLPRVPEKFMEPLPQKQMKEMPAPAFSGVQATETPASAAAVPARAPRGQAKSPENAAAAVSSLVPAGPKVVNGQGLTGAPAATDPVVPAAVPAARVTPAAVGSSPAPAAAAVAAPVTAAKVEPVASVLVPLPVEPVAVELQPIALESIDEDAPALATASAPVAPPSPEVPLAPTREQAVLLERAAREQQRREEALRKAEAADAKQRAKQQAEAGRKAAREQAAAEKRAAELAKQDAEILRKQAEAEKKRADADARKQAGTNQSGTKKQAAAPHDVLGSAGTR
jgi:pilus assembly protein CpaC